MEFKNKIKAAVKSNKSLVCVGLDPDPNRMPKGTNSLLEFNKAIIEATKDLVCCYKPNSAFYEAFGPEGIEDLKLTCEYIKRVSPGIPIILDYKRADIGNTNRGYTQFAFDYLGVDAVTVSPYMGRESLSPFLNFKEKGIIILCRTSNEGSGELQDLVVEGQKLYQYLAKRISQDWNTNNNCCLVVGATYPHEMAELRGITGDSMLFLVPGIGAQGGDIEATLRAGLNSKGEGVIINSSRGIIYASGRSDYAAAARNAALELRNEINKYREIITS